MKKQNSAVMPEADVGDYMIYLIAFLAVLISIVFYYVYQKRKSRRDCVLLMGLTNSGKTLIYSHLVYSKFVNTHTSIKENCGELSVNNKTIKLVDIPGNERLRGTYFDQYKESVKGIIFVIDSLTLPTDVVNVAKYLYDLLTDASIENCRPHVLILCNKQDEITAKGKTIITALLEAEMETIRTIHESEHNKNEKFQFSKLPMQIEFAESQASGDDVHLGDLKKWLDNIV